MGIDIDAVYAGDNMNAAYVKSQGGTMLLEITDVTVKEFGDDGEEKVKKAVLHFRNEEKQLSLNVTNKNVLKEAFGPNTDSWLGKLISVQVGRTTYKGKPIDCIQVFIPAQSSPAPAATQERTLGEVGSSRLAAALTDKGLDMLDLRNHLIASKVAFSTLPMTTSMWPAALMPHIKAWLDNPKAKVEPESDIPW